MENSVPVVDPTPDPIVTACEFQPSTLDCIVVRLGWDDIGIALTPPTIVPIVIP